MPDSPVFLFRGQAATSSAVAAVGGTLLLAIVVVASVAALQLRVQAISIQHQRAAGQSVSLTAHAAQVFAAADFVLGTIQDEVGALHPSSSAELRRYFDIPAENDRLFRRDESFQPISMLAILDADGQMVSVSRAEPTPSINVSGSDYFKTAMVSREHKTIVGRATIDPRTGDWSFHLARRLETNDGTFLGVAVASISCAELASLYEQLRMGSRDDRSAKLTAISLVRDDMTVLARAPFDTEVLGKHLNPAGAYARVPAVRAAEGGGDIVLTWDDDPAAASQVEVVAHRVPGAPVYIVIATRDDYYLAGWRRQAEWVALVAGVSFLFCAYIFRVLFRSLRRRESALVESQRLRRIAETASLAKSRFLATVSHEIRTPMNGILGTAELLAAAKLEPAARRLASTLLRSGRSLLRILNDILDFSKLEAGELRLSVMPFNVRSVIDDVHDLFEALADSKGLNFSAEVHDAVPEAVVGDVDRVRQVLGNLVSNALKFTEWGEVTAHVSATESAGAGARRPMLHFEVCDTGIGIPDEMHDRIFDVFFQADDSVERHVGGTGLGLAISKRIVELMEGRIAFENMPQGGTRFWFEIPLRPADPGDETYSMRPAAASPERPAEQGAEALHVLVVEDDATNAMVVEAQLAMLGSTCEVAVDGESAMALLRSTRYDLVLMDCMLPGLSGYDVVRAWRRVEFAEGRGHTPIVALTASALASIASQAADAGMDDFLTKPCALVPLEAMLQKYALSGRRLG